MLCMHQKKPPKASYLQHANGLQQVLLLSLELLVHVIHLSIHLRGTAYQTKDHTSLIWDSALAFAVPIHLRGTAYQTLDKAL